MKTTLFPLLASFSLATTAFSSPVLNVDFQDGSTGAGISGGLYSRDSVETQGRITVADSSTSPADPFGKAENKSLLIEKTGEGLPVPTIRWNFPEINAGELSFTVYAPQTDESGNSTGMAYLYSGDLIGMGIGWNDSGTLFILGRLTDADTENAHIRFPGTLLPLNEPVHIRIVFSADLKFSVFINDAILETADGQSGFFLREGATSPDNVRFAQPSSTDMNARFFLDDISLVSTP